MAKTNEKNNPLSMFNAEVKNDFLKTITNEGTAKYYARIFTITSKYEEALGKDLSRFSLKEIEKILYDFQARNRHTVETYGRVISSYLNWCIQQGITDENPLSELTSDDFDKYVINKENYLTEKQLRRYEDLCANYQDAVILRLLFVGVGGREFSEISNLKIDDVNFEDNTLHLVNSLKVDDRGFPTKFTERIIKVDDRTMYLIKGAIEQKTYIKRNGFMSREAENVREFTDLVENDYVVRASVTKNEHIYSPVDKHVIYRRLSTLEKTLGIEGLTSKLIQRSGMIYYANQLIGDANEITLEDLKIVADRFNLKSYFNLKSFLTIENIRKTYPK